MGSVPVSKEGSAVYSKKAIAAAQKKGACGMLGSPNDYGVTPEASIKMNAFLMVATSLCYLIIQGPAFQYARGKPQESAAALNVEVAETEHW